MMSPHLPIWMPDILVRFDPVGWSKVNITPKTNFLFFLIRWRKQIHFLPLIRTTGTSGAGWRRAWLTFNGTHLCVTCTPCTPCISELPIRIRFYMSKQKFLTAAWPTECSLGEKWPHLNYISSNQRPVTYENSLLKMDKLLAGNCVVKLLQWTENTFTDRCTYLQAQTYKVLK